MPINKKALAITIAQLVVPLAVLTYMIAALIVLDSEQYPYMRMGASIYVGMSLVGAFVLIFARMGAIRKPRIRTTQDD